jgi:hypothetical protein
MRQEISSLAWSGWEAPMLDGPELTTEMQAAVDGVFARLPVHYQAGIIKARIERAVACSKVVGGSACEAAARSAVVEMFSSLDCVIATRGKLAPFARSRACRAPDAGYSSVTGA